MARVSGSIAENQALRATLPAGWKVTDSDNESMTIDPPGDAVGQVYMASAEASTPATADAGLDKYIHAILSSGAFHDGKSCVARTKRTVGGVDGVIEGVCYKVTTDKGDSFSVIELIWYGASKDQRLYYELDRYVYQPERAQDFVDASMPIERSIEWKYR